MYLKTSFDQLVAFLQVLQPNFSLWAIMAQPRVIVSFQSLCGIGLIINENYTKIKKMLNGNTHLNYQKYLFVQ